MSTFYNISPSSHFSPAFECKWKYLRAYIHIFWRKVDFHFLLIIAHKIFRKLHKAIKILSNTLLGYLGRMEIEKGSSRNSKFCFIKHQPIQYNHPSCQALYKSMYLIFLLNHLESSYLFCWDTPFHNDLTTTVFLPKLEWKLDPLSIKGSASHKWTWRWKKNGFNNNFSLKSSFHQAEK